MQMQKKFKNFYFVMAFVMVGTSGCVTPERVQEEVLQKSDRALCMEYMTSPTLNILDGERAREISRRRLDCWQYGNVAEERRKADADFNNSWPGKKPSQPQTYIQPTNNPNACIQDGGTVSCPYHSNTRSRPVFK
jgi:hypothetical protein